MSDSEEDPAVVEARKIDYRDGRFYCPFPGWWSGRNSRKRLQDLQQGPHLSSGPANTDAQGSSPESKTNSLLRSTAH